MCVIDKNTKVYYSHPMLLYNTQREKEELEFLRSLSDKVICPNNDIGYCQRGIKGYLNIVRWADLVVVSTINGILTSGIFAEVKYALKLNIPVKKLVEKTLIEFSNDELSYKSK